MEWLEAELIINDEQLKTISLSSYITSSIHFAKKVKSAWNSWSCRAWNTIL